MLAWKDFVFSLVPVMVECVFVKLAVDWFEWEMGASQSTVQQDQH